MYVLDTNILEYYLGRHQGFAGLTERIEAADELKLVATTIINAQEIVSHAVNIKDSPAIKKQKILTLYSDLHKVTAIFKRFDILPYTEEAHGYFDTLARFQTTIGTRDRRIAAIALANDATVITANVQHFEIIPGLPVLTWNDN